MANRAGQSGERLSTRLIILMAFACGAMAANLYYAQTLISEIGPEIGLSKGLAGVVVTLTQLGYGVGLFLLVPLGDLYENRRLALIMTGGTFFSTLGIAVSRGPIAFLAASLITGICATGAQILLPLASHFTPPERQGRIIGQIMTGLLAGIMLARPLASFMTGMFGWRSVYFMSAGLMALIGGRARPHTSLPRAAIAEELRRDPGVNDLAGAQVSPIAVTRFLSGRALRCLQSFLDCRSTGSFAQLWLQPQSGRAFRPRRSWRRDGCSGSRRVS